MQAALEKFVKVNI